MPMMPFGHQNTRIRNKSMCVSVCTDTAEAGDSVFVSMKSVFVSCSRFAADTLMINKQTFIFCSSTVRSGAQ